MNDQDRDLILSLAEGRLSRTAAEDATARIEADPELASEYAQQLSAIEFLGSSADPNMTATERETLHANLIAQLHLEPEPTPVVAPSRGSRWWQPVFGLAAAAAVIAAIVILPGTLTGDSSDTSFEVAVGALESDVIESTTTAAATSEAPLAGTGDTRATADASDGTASALGSEESINMIYDTGTVPLDELLVQVQGALNRNDAYSKLAPLELEETSVLDEDALSVCLERIGADLPDVQNIVPIGKTVDAAGSTIVHLGFDSGSGVESGSGASVDLSTCEIVDFSSK